MFLKMETNEKADAIKAWMATHKKLETQGTLSREFGKSITSINLAVNKKMVTDGAEKLVNEIYEYLSNKYGI